jgi:hypothetical protein
LPSLPCLLTIPSPNLGNREVKQAAREQAVRDQAVRKQHAEEQDRYNKYEEQERRQRVKRAQRQQERAAEDKEKRDQQEKLEKQQEAAHSKAAEDLAHQTRKRMLGRCISSLSHQLTLFFRTVSLDGGRKNRQSAQPAEVKPTEGVFVRRHLLFEG